MSKECVVAAYESLPKAEEAVHILHRAEFPAKQISLVASKLPEDSELAKELAMDDDGVQDAAIGAGLGGVLGILAGVSMAAVSGLGILFLIGPIGVGIAGATTGAILGGLTGWGVHKVEIEHYEECLKSGKVLVIANGTPLELAHADRILRETDVEEVKLYADSDSESPEVLDI